MDGVIITACRKSKAKVSGSLLSNDYFADSTWGGGGAGVTYGVESYQALYALLGESIAGDEEKDKAEEAEEREQK